LQFAVAANTASFCFIGLFFWRSLQVRPGLLKEPLGLLSARLLQTGWPSCHSTNNAKALKERWNYKVINIYYSTLQWPSKSYSHLHIGEGWKQTDTSFPIALDIEYSWKRQSG